MMGRQRMLSMSRCVATLSVPSRKVANFVMQHHDGGVLFRLGVPGLYCRLLWLWYHWRGFRDVEFITTWDTLSAPGWSNVRDLDLSKNKDLAWIDRFVGLRLAVTGGFVVATSCRTGNNDRAFAYLDTLADRLSILGMMELAYTYSYRGSQ